LPIQPPVQRGWQLGVRYNNTDTGIVLTNVVRGSAAQLAGLQIGDRIVALGTERVGLVGNQVVQTSQVLQRQVSFQGDVLLLVQPRNNRGLINFSVRLGRR
jgi:predicted metalloprotease with PDZ domain